MKINKNNNVNMFVEQIHGGSTNAVDIDKDLKIDETNLSMEDVFRPKLSVGRTPPNINKITQNDTNEGEHFLNYKRPRSGSSPSELERHKIRKHMETENTKSLESSNMVDESRGTIEGTIQNILQSLENINNYTSHEMNGAICFTKEDQNNVRQALFTVYKHVTTLAYKVGKIEMEGYQKNSKTSSTEVSPVECQVERKKTYSEITKENKGNYTQEKWSTPPQVKKNETVVRIKGKSDAKEVMDEIKKNINTNQLGGVLKRIQHLQSGGVLIECQTEDQQRQLRERLAKKEQFVVKELQNTDPMIMLTGILKGYTPDNFIDELVTENCKLTTEFGPDVRKYFKYVTRRECRNKQKENWIIQTTPPIFKWFMKNEISFDLTKIFTVEYTNITMCYKCCTFGHIAKYCTGKICCHKCGGDHQGKDCQENTELDCPNCKKMRLNERRHTARDPKCPAFIQRVQRLRQYTNYEVRDQQNHF